MKKKIIIAIGIFLSLGLILAVFIFSGGSDNPSRQYFQVQRGGFEILVNASGELQAENSENIQAPVELRSNNIRIENVRIQDLVPEGTEVNPGDWVATLDRSEADIALKDLEDLVQQASVQYIRTQLDTTITLRNLRDEMVNLEYELEERMLTLEQSVFEPPATIRQAEISLERAQRALEQAKKNYILRHRQSEESMSEASINLYRRQRRYDELKEVLDNFIITAPKSGMVIYYREWNGRKRMVGSIITPRNLTVATLPDLSSMMSRLYINEIDISKIRAGQNVRITVDAIPDARYTGRVMNVANVGQQLPGSDSKVFEVLISINENDNLLRPAMTTSNVIVTNSFADVLFIPLEAMHISDSIPYVFTTRGVRQVVMTGEANGNFVIVEEGLNEGDRIYLNIPEDYETYRKSGEELIVKINERKKQRIADEEKRLTMQNVNDMPSAGPGAGVAHRETIE
jgi:HlyD family secretion protein